MTVEVWTTIFVILTFMVYLYIGWRSRVRDSKGFFIADQGVPAIANGAATAADWMSAASFYGDGGFNFISWLRWVDLFNGVDWRVCAAGATAGSLFAKVW